MARPAPTSLAMARYASSRTDSLSLSRTARDRPVVGIAVTGWAAARLSACCSRRSILKSSSRMDSSLSHGAACDPRPKVRRITDFIFRPGRYLLAAVNYREIMRRRFILGSTQPQVILARIQENIEALRQSSLPYQISFSTGIVLTLRAAFHEIGFPSSLVRDSRITSQTVPPMPASFASIGAHRGLI